MSRTIIMNAVTLLAVTAAIMTKLISQGHNLIIKMRLKLFLFNSDFKMRLQKITYLCYLGNHLGLSQNFNPKILTYLR